MQHIQFDKLQCSLLLLSNFMLILDSPNVTGSWDQGGFGGPDPPPRLNKELVLLLHKQCIRF